MVGLCAGDFAVQVVALKCNGFEVVEHEAMNMAAAVGHGDALAVKFFNLAS